MDSSLIDAFAVSVGPTLAVMVGAFINWRASLRATEAAAAAEKATRQTGLDAFKAQEAASNAATAAAEAARQLVITARQTDSKLDHIVETGDKTHTIVNSQRTEMEEKIEIMRTEILALKGLLRGTSQNHR